MKKLLSLSLLALLTCILQLNAISEPVRCVTEVEECEGAFGVLVEINTSSSCKLNSGSINITINNSSGSPQTATLNLTGPVTRSMSVPLDEDQNTFPNLFRSLPNGTFTLTTDIFGCRYTCTNIVINNKKLNCFPFLYCCTN